MEWGRNSAGGLCSFTGDRQAFLYMLDIMSLDSSHMPIAGMADIEGIKERRRNKWH
jgi:hypothetical protein